MKSLIVLLALAGTSVASAQNSGILHGEEAEIRRLWNPISDYVALHAGNAPETWDELEKDGWNVADFNRQYQRDRGVSLTDRYVFVNREIQTPREGKIKVVVIRSAPINIDNYSHDLRLFVYITGGKVGTSSLHEDEAVKVFADAGLELPGKGKKADRETLVGQKYEYISADPTPSVAPKPTLAPDKTIQNARSAPAVSNPVEQQAKVTVWKSSSGYLSLVSIIVLGLVIGIGAFLTRRK